MKKIVLLAFILGSIGTLSSSAGCTRPEKSGFLKPYVGFKKVSPLNPDLQYIRPNVNWSKYHKVRIAHVVTYIHNPPKQDVYRAVNPDDLKHITDYFENKLSEHFSKDFEITAQPGPDVLDIHSAITRIRPTDRAARAASFFIPYAIASAAVTSGYQEVTNSSLMMGEAGIEVEFCESLTSKRLFGFVGLHLGSSIEPQQITKWGITEHALDKWAKSLTEELHKLQQ